MNITPHPEMSKLLLIEPCDQTRDWVRHVLASEPIEIHHAGSADEARRQLSDCQPDVVLLAAGLTETSGLEWLRTDSQASCRDAAVVMLTTDERVDAMVDALEQGATDYIVRPCTDAMLRARLRNALRTRQELLRLSAERDLAEAGRQAKGEFLTNMSHEIRTPMTAILGFADLLVANVLRQENIAAAKTIKRNGEYLLGLINDLLDLSKIEAGHMDVERLECSPGQILADVASLMRVRASAKGLVLSLEFDGPIPEFIRCDPTRLRQILINLVSNAVKFSEQGTVRFVARLEGAASNQQLRFDVIDQGIGMSPQQMARLFRPFVQADLATARHFGGTGLGLTISLRLAELLGGTIRADSTPDVGSTFSLFVATGPLDAVRWIDDPYLHRSDCPPLECEEPIAQRLDCRILLVEDGPDNQRLITFLLRKEGAQVEVAANGQLGLERALAAQAHGEPFDLILMDMQMPVLDGYQATSRLRANGYQAPIIALTAHAMTGDRQKCLHAGCDGYTTKPIRRDELLELVSRHTCARPMEPQLSRQRQAECILMSTIESKRAQARGFGDERRNEPRTSLSMGVWIVPLRDNRAVVEEVFSAVTRDMTSTGMGLLTTTLPTTDEVLLRLAGSETGDYLRASVRCSMPLGAGFHQVGMQVLDIAETAEYPELDGIDA